MVPGLLCFLVLAGIPASTPNAAFAHGGGGGGHGGGLGGAAILAAVISVVAVVFLVGLSAMASHLTKERTRKAIDGGP